MFTVSREIDFCYGHRLLGYAGKCCHLHGHNGRAVLVFAAAELDAAGMVLDFSEIKRVISGWIDEHLDHRMVLQRRPGRARAAKIGRADVPDGREPDSGEHRQADLRGRPRERLPGQRGPLVGDAPLLGGVLSLKSRSFVVPASAGIRWPRRMSRRPAKAGTTNTPRNATVRAARWRAGTGLFPPGKPHRCFGGGDTPNTRLSSSVFGQDSLWQSLPATPKGRAGFPMSRFSPSLSLHASPLSVYTPVLIPQPIRLIICAD